MKEAIFKAHMSDQYPDKLDIEIDRERLKNYLRAKWLLAWTLPLTALGVISGLPSAKDLERSHASFAEGFPHILRAMVEGAGVMFVIALLLYFAISHHVASRFARTLEVRVDGPFLHIRQQSYLLSDRKLHFRSIVDYSTIQGFLLRCFNLHALQMTTPAGGVNSIINIPGIKDCLKVRDLLSEIDRLRENQ